MTLAAAIAGAIALVSTSAIAASRPADCKLVIEGKAYIDGVCDFDVDKDGSFEISAGDYFAYVNLTGKDRAEASWNADPQSTHAQTQLGVLSRKGACWVGRAVEICARNLSAAQLASVRASRPDGYMITPDIPGASSACVGARGGRWEEGIPIVLRRCRLPDDKVFVRADGTLKLDKHPGLCVDAPKAADGNPAQLVLSGCDRSHLQWTSEAAAAQPAPIRSADGLCWKVDLPADENAEFPFPMLAVPCGDAATAKFTFDKD